MPYPNEHSARLANPDKFDEFRRTNGGTIFGHTKVPATIAIIWGHTDGEPDDAWHPQALRFPVKNYTATEAKKWLKDNNVKFQSFEEAKKDSKDYSDIMPDKETANQIYLMSPIFDETALAFCQALDCISKDEDCTVLMNSPGGSVFAGWTIIGKMKERTGKNNAKVYGHAASMSMYFLLYCDNVEALEVTRFLIHRASGYVENDDDQKFLDGINSDLRKHMESKLNVEVLEKICDCTMDDIFNGDKVKDVWLTAKQAKKIGLINEVIRMAPQEIEAFNKNIVAMVGFSRGSEPARGSEKPEHITDTEQIINLQTQKPMTKEEFKAQHPEIYAVILAEGEAKGEVKGTNAERDRVQSFLAYVDYDKEYVLKSVKEGTAMTGAVTSEMQVKMFNAIKLGAIKVDSTGKVVTGEVDDKTAEQKAVEAAEAEVKANNKKIVDFHKN